MSSDNKERSYKWAGWLILLAVIAGLYWVVIGFWMDADSTLWRGVWNSLLWRGLFPSGWRIWQATVLAVLLLAVAAAIAALMAEEEGKLRKLFTVKAVVLGLLVPTILVVNINTQAIAYADSTTFVVADLDAVPSTLMRVSDSARTATEDGFYTRHGIGGVRANLTQGELDMNWYARAASLKGATIAITRTSESDNNSYIMKESLSYIWGGETPGWSAIRNGLHRQPVHSVAFWTGEGSVQTCAFDGPYELNKAFGGSWGRNLTDEIIGRFPRLFWNTDDMWGYCRPSADGGRAQPVIVIPVTQWVGVRSSHAWRAAGVLVVTGSPSGDAQIQYVPSPEVGEFPGPVYPASLAARQRENIDGLAGWRNHWLYDFGFDPISTETQGSNSSEFLLMDQATGRQYWVTPMAPGNSDSQRVIAYSVIPADEATHGQLNEQRVFVLNNDSPLAVNLDDLEARVRNEMTVRVPGFFPGGGELIEFLPVDNTSWQVYGEVSGRVAYRIEVQVDQRVRPLIVELNDDGSVAGPTGAVPPGVDTPGMVVPPADGLSSCAADLGQLSSAQLAQCLSDIALELQRR